MKPEELTEEEIILAFAVSDDAWNLQRARTFPSETVQMRAYAPWMDDAALVR